MTVLLVDIRSWLQTGTQIVAGKLESLRREARKGMNENLKNSAPLRLCGLGDVNSYDILFLAKAQRIDRGKEMIFEYTLFSCCFYRVIYSIIALSIHGSFKNVACNCEVLISVVIPVLCQCFLHPQ